MCWPITQRHDRSTAAHTPNGPRSTHICFVRLPDGSVQVMSIFVAPARAALICTKATGEAGYFRAFSPTRGTRGNCIKVELAETAHKKYMSSHDQGGHMLETCRDIVGEREGGAVSGSERSSTSANRIETIPPAELAYTGLTHLFLSIFITKTLLFQFIKSCHRHA